jgi:hypothetical protein
MQMRIIVAFVLFAAMTVAAQAQTGAVEGSIADAAGKSLAGVTVQIEGTQLGAITKADGTFRVERVPVGEQWLTAKLIGYEPVRENVTVVSAGTVRVTFRLKESAIESDEIQVRAKGKVQEQSDTRTSVTRIEPREAKYLPGAAEDVMRSLRSLPGVLAPNDFSAQLVIRGSGPDQNLIVLDDIEVFNPYRLYGLISMFNPETVSDITLISGGFPAKYSDRLSAVLDVTNREGTATSAIEGKLSASLTNANLVLEGKLPDALNGGWLLSGRRTYYDLLLGPIARSAKLVDGDVAFPNFRDLQFKTIIRPWSQHSFVINALTSRDGTDIVSSAERDRIDSITISDRSYNSLVGLSWRYSPTSDFLSKTIVSWYENVGKTEFGGEGGSQLLYGDLSRDSVIKLLRSLPAEIQDSLRSRGINPENPPALSIDDGKASFNFRKYTLRNESNAHIGNHFVEFGGGVDLIHTGLEFNSKQDSLLKALRDASGRGGLPEQVDESADYYRGHVFAQDRISFDDRFFLQLGARYDFYRVIDKGYFAPRINASWAIDPLTTLRGAFGIYYQSPGYEKLVDGRSFFDLTSPRIADLEAEQATHYVLGLDRMLTEEWQVRVEGYYKRFSDLIVRERVQGVSYISEPVAGGNLRYPSGWTPPVVVIDDSSTTIPVNDSQGEAYGVEILLQKIGGTKDSRLNGWVSYALAWANRYRYGATVPFNFDQRHTLNIVLNYRPNDWLELGASFRFGSGFPYTPAVGFGPLIVMRKDSTGTAQPAIATNIFGETLFTIDRGGDDNDNTAHLPPYHRLDLRGTVYANWWGLDWAFYLDIVNVYNHSNILSRSFRVDKEKIELTTRDVSMLPILPTLGFNVRF